MADDNNVLSLAAARQRSRSENPTPSTSDVPSFEQRREAAREVLKARARTPTTKGNDMNPTTLTQAIATIIDESQRLDPDQFADELAAIVDDMAVGKDFEDNADDLYLEAIVDGIRWGAQAAVNVERGRGAMLRVCLPDGARITHEWADDADADQAIKDALAAIEGARVTAQKVGDE